MRVGGGTVDVTENFLGQTKLVRSGVRARLSVVLFWGKKKGICGHAREIVRLNIMMAIYTYRTYTGSAHAGPASKNPDILPVGRTTDTNDLEPPVPS